MAKNLDEIIIFPLFNLFEKAAQTKPLRSLKSSFNYLAAIKNYKLQAKDPNARKRSYGWNQFQHACSRGHTGKVRIMLEAGADPNIENDTWMGGRPILLAANGRHPEHTETVEILLNRPDIDLSFTCKLDTALHLAISSGNVKTFELLLKDGRTDPNQKNSAGQTPLMNTINFAQPEMLKMLLDDPRVDVTGTMMASCSLLDRAKSVAKPSSPLDRAIRKRCGLKQKTRGERKRAQKVVRILEADERIKALHDNKALHLDATAKNKPILH